MAIFGCAPAIENSPNKCNRGSIYQHAIPPWFLTDPHHQCLSPNETESSNQEQRVQEAVGIATSCLGAKPWILSFVVETPSLSKMSSTFALAMVFFSSDTFTRMLTSFVIGGRSFESD
uniref:Uncharacterized protein n=1 Tax=Oryza rufipogon TaxID=4529 RepID=A0A0E0PX54_ORYRU